jgi:Restriction endonuclease fold toxin 7
VIEALGGAAIVEGITVAAVGATLVTFGEEILGAMGNASPYSTPGVDFLQSAGGTKSLNSEGKNKQPDQAALQRGRDNEKKALQEEGLTKNNKTKTVIDPKTGKEVKVKPDGENKTTVGEVKDTKTVSNTRQIRGEREVAKQEGKDLKIITGENTKVSKTIPQNEVVRKPYLGPPE